jgi:hypothetical protein
LCGVDFIAEQEAKEEGPGSERHSGTRRKETYIQAGECPTEKVSSKLIGAVRMPRKFPS